MKYLACSAARSYSFRRVTFEKGQYSAPSTDSTDISALANTIQALSPEARAALLEALNDTP
jgi:hypothetical protein